MDFLTENGILVLLAKHQKGKSARVYAINEYILRGTIIRFNNSDRTLLKKYKGNVHLIHGDGSKGVAKYAPYDAIIVTAGAPAIQNELLKQLKIGGKLVIPVGDGRENQKMHRITRMSENKFHREILGDFKFVPLVGDGGWK